MPEPKTTECQYCDGTGLAPMGDGDDHPATSCGFCEDGRVPVRERPWWDVLPGDYNELTRERDGYRADAEAERRRSDLWGY